DIQNRAVRSRRLVSDARCCEGVVFEEAWAIYDGFWRERQLQGKSPESGKVLVTETSYDDRGLLYDETVEQALPGNPGAYVPGGSSWKNRSRDHYDELGRQVRTEWFRGSSVAHATTTSYSADSVTVTGPDGRRVRERVDGLGRTIAVEEHDGQAWVSSSYRYDLADRLISVTDPAGNKMDYSYNLAGWRIGQADPNRGGVLFGYDNAGNQTVAAHANGDQIHTRYDALNRPFERRAGSTTGQVLASWQYDTAPLGKGKPHKETSGGWVSEVLGYDIKGRATGSRLVVPAGIAGLSGSYDITQTYDRADRVRSVTYPAIGGLPQETVTTDYNTLGLATRMVGLSEYVWAVSYDDRGRKNEAGFGPRPGGNTWMGKKWTYDVDQRINGAETFIAGTGVVSRHELSFDPAGNLKEKLTSQNGLAWRECFGYDARSRLTAAHTVAAATSCADGMPGTGDQPYAHSYQYSADGKMVNRTENGLSKAYTYPAAGSARPHAPTRVGSDTYTWDTAGRLASRPGETFSWDVQGRLQSVAGPGGTTSFGYDASGQRLLRRTPDGRATLYFAGHEITVNANGSPVTSVRPYTFDREVVATRTLAGVDYLVSDATGSVEMSVPSGGTPSASRAYDPYGRVRAQTGGDMATDRGFAGQIEDASTRLSYLNARYYDAGIGIFISTDALYDTSKVKSLNPYSYSSNNPATYSDPSGLYSMYAWGLEVENSKLRAQNRELIAHIGLLNSHIAELQDVIRRQQDAINEMLTYIDALEAEIARQASIIEQLQARVAYLEGVVRAQQREISRLRGIIAYQAGVIRAQASVIAYQRSIIIGLVFEAIQPQYQEAVLTSIFNGTGIPIRMVNSINLETLRNDGPLVPATWDGEPHILGSRRVEAERQGAILQGELWAAENEIARLQVESSIHEAYRDEYYAELHSTDPWDMACDANSVGGGAYTLAGGSNPYIAIPSAGFSIYCVMRNQ
ncbi:MAG TPA: hypothetical protein DGG94_02645, partial [Micromonosporaceae bacterium]|nr:hypothetical protein [Micromonosporaceae bacterium]